MHDSKQLKNDVYLLQFGRTRALYLKKRGHEMAIFPDLGKLTHMDQWQRPIKVQNPPPPLLASVCDVQIVLIGSRRTQVLELGPTD